MTGSLSLYRRHRPGSFDEVVGQQHVVRTLRNAVEQDKVNHAYLFVGSRGTGKTSMAKILARSLNCERGGPTVTPCGECESCRSIAAGTSVDVIEMDAASNRSVDDIRDLRERVAFAPAVGGWKVYILDEAHMLTKEAWNAFLKTLEEPPPNTVFVLATTEAAKVMQTIVDRCQRFDFQRPGLEQIATVLRRVAGSEGIEIDETSVAMVARSATGSFRDALGTLDQLVAFNGPQIELSGVLEVLGAVERDLLFETLDAVSAEDPAAALHVVEKMSDSGRDAVQFARDLLEHLRALLLIQATGELPDSLLIAEDDAGRMRSQAGAVGGANLMRTIDELAAALAAVRNGDEARMAIEVALLKAARPDLDPSTQGLTRRLERVERHLAGGDTPAATSLPAATAPPAATTPPAAPARPDPKPSAPPESATREQAAPDSAPSSRTAPEPDSGQQEQSRSAPVGDAGSAGDGADPTPSGETAPAADSAGSGDLAEDPPQESPENARQEAARDVPPVASQAAPPVASLTLDDAQRIWPAALERLREEGQNLLAALFEGAHPVAIDPAAGTLEIGFPSASAFSKRQAEEPPRRQALAQALADTFGEPLRPTFTQLEDQDAPAAAQGGEKADEDEMFNRLKTQFNAEEVN